jgi:hypothetical protein
MFRLLYLLKCGKLTRSPTFPSSQTFTVTDNYNDDYYGEIKLSINGRRYVPTQLVSPGENIQMLLFPPFQSNGRNLQEIHGL